MDWLEAEDEGETLLLQKMSNLDSIKELTVQQRSQALLIAVRQQNSELAKHLLNYKTVNPNADDEFGCSAVMFASTYGLVECLELMLSLPHCVINKRSHSMQTALHFAAKNGQFACTEMLVNNGAMVNVSDDWGETPLMLAVRAGSMDTVNILLKAGARLEMTNLRGMDALTFAAQGGFVNIMQVLIDRHCDVNKVNKSSPLHQAALYGHVGCVKLLLNAGARHDSRDIHGILPIELATQTDKHLVVKCLIEYGTPDEFKNLALAAACKNNGLRSVRVLLHFGTDPSATDMQGLPAFFWAVAQNNIEITCYLIRHNANVNKTLSRVYLINSEFRELSSELDLDAVSPLVIAAFRDCREIVQILVIAGANPVPVLRFWELGLLPSDISSNVEFISWLARRQGRPRSLAFICRQTIRESLINPVHKQIKSLPLPKTLLEYLDFSDLNSIL